MALRNATANTRETAVARHLSQVFNYMAGGVGLSGIVAWLTVNSPALLQVAIKGNLVFMLVWLAFGFFMHRIVFSLQPAVALGVFAAFSALTGFSLAPLMLVYTGASIATAFGVAAVMFAGASLYGYVTNKSLSGWGTFLMMGVWGLLGAMLINLGFALFGSPLAGLQTVISIIAVPLFAALTAYNVNQIKETFAMYGGNELMRSRLAILNATSLYINFLNMFIQLLSLIGVRRD
ncbi:MAG TPA: Bax inhibitor-1/YccA family protein [Alphaproteobacteria bacterium]|nr:Bax inhibitor-1/YccA family protein [Alphaproteobacteria bacterium]